VIVVRDDLGVLEIFANQFESKAETAHKICGLAQKWQIGDWMGPPTLRYQGLDGATHSPVPRKCGWPSRPFGPGRRRPGAARAIPISRPASPPRPLGPPGWVLTRERRRTAHPPAAPASRSAFSASTARAAWAATSPPGMRNAQAAFVAIPPRAAAPAHSISEVRLRGSRGTSR